MAGEVLPEKKVKKAFVKEGGPLSSLPGIGSSSDSDPLAPLYFPDPDIPDFKGSYNAEPIPGRNWPPAPKPRKQPNMDMDPGQPPISYTLNS